MLSVLTFSGERFYQGCRALVNAPLAVDLCFISTPRRQGISNETKLSIQVLIA